MGREIIYFNGQEISRDELIHIMMRFYKESNVYNKKNYLATISWLERTSSIYKLHYHLVRNEFQKIQSLFAHLSSNILEFEVQLLEKYLDTHKIKKEFYEEMVKFTQSDRHHHFTKGLGDEKSILRNILVRYPLRDIIDRAFYWADTKQKDNFWGDKHRDFQIWLDRQNVNKILYC